MAKFKNKKTGKIVEESLIFYVNKLRSDSNYEEIKSIPEEVKEKKKDKKAEEVEDKPLH